MTEKRFKYYEEPNGEFSFPYIRSDDDKQIISLYECCDLLNKQHETIQSLEKEHARQENQIKLSYDKINKIQKENEQLKQDGLYWGTTAEARLKEIDKLRKENKEYIRGLNLSKATRQSWASDVRELREENTQLEKENEELKQEVDLLRKGLRTYEDILPMFLTPMEISNFRGELSAFEIEKMKFYNEHPNRCKLSINGNLIE